MKKALEKIEFLEKEILYLFSHEFKTPISAISNFIVILQKYVQKIEDEKLKYKISDIINYIEINTTVLNEFLDNILSLQKIRYEGYEIEYQEINIVNIIKKLSYTYSVFFDKEYKVNIPKKVIIKWDNTLLTILLNNLINNAFKYSKTKVKITLEEKKDKVLFVVENDGENISEKLKKDIFNRFVSGKDKNIHSGSGIGLYLVKIILDSINSEIEIKKSKLGGPKFIVKIPKCPWNGKLKYL